LRERLAQRCGLPPEALAPDFVPTHEASAAGSVVDVLQRHPEAPTFGSPESKAASVSVCSRSSGESCNIDRRTGPD